MKKMQKFGKETLSKSQPREERKNTLSNPQNINLYYIFTQQHKKWVFPTTHTLSNPKNDFPATHTFNKTQNEFPTMGKMEKSTKVVKGNTHELQLHDREKMMDEQ